MTYKTPEAKKWQETLGWEAKRQGRSLQWLTDPIYVGITMFVSRDRDIDSSIKLTLDALNGVLYRDDTQVVHLNVKKEYDKENPHMEIEIESMK